MWYVILGGLVIALGFYCYIKALEKIEHWTKLRGHKRFKKNMERTNRRDSARRKAQIAAVQAGIEDRHARRLRKARRRGLRKDIYDPSELGRLRDLDARTTWSSIQKTKSRKPNPQTGEWHPGINRKGKH